MFLSKYGVARIIYIPVIKRGVVDFAVGADWTPAAGDVKISKDGGAAANVTNLPTAIAMGNGAIWQFSLTATEMQAAQVVVTVADSATKAVEDQSFIVETYGDASGQHAFDLDTASQVVASVTGSVGSVAAGGITASSIATGAIDADAIAADAVTEIQSGLATAAALTVVDDFLDTEIAAIKAKTDNLPADPADASDVAALIDALPTANENADALLDRTDGVETGLTLRNALRLNTAVLAGKLSGARSGSEVFRNAVADSKNRLTVASDSTGNRTAITTDLT